MFHKVALRSLLFRDSVSWLVRTGSGTDGLTADVLVSSILSSSSHSHILSIWYFIYHNPSHYAYAFVSYINQSKFMEFCKSSKRSLYVKHKIYQQYNNNEYMMMFLLQYCIPFPFKFSYSCCKRTTRSICLVICVLYHKANNCSNPIATITTTARTSSELQQLHKKYITTGVL